MSASIMLHGPFAASARLVGPGEFVDKPFVSLEISVTGISVTLVSLDADGLEALSAACGEARVQLAAIAPRKPQSELSCAVDHGGEPCPGYPDDPPEYEPDDSEAQRIAEVYADARAEQDRGL